jgi:radical SAM protein with 4Fe4S-binding SPASM domain
MEYVEHISSDKFERWPGKAFTLHRLDFELTERCNNNCIHCSINLPADDRSAFERELSTDEIQRILREVAALGGMEVRFTGGEPLLREDFGELYLIARRLGLKVMIFTNGRLIDQRLTDLFAKIPPLIPIEITVYGMHADSYEAVTRVKGSFAQFRRGMELLRERNVPFAVKTVMLPPNRHEIDEIESFAAEIPWMDAPPQRVVFLEKRCRRDDPGKDREIVAMRPSPEEALTAITRHVPQYRKEMDEFCHKFLGPPGDELFPCGAAHGGCVDAYGRLEPCLELRAPELTYDLRNGSLKEGMQDVLARVRAMRASNAEYLRRCARCFLKGLCDQCPARSWNETGTLDTPIDFHCSIAHLQAQWLGLLRPGEHAWEIEDWRSRIGHVLKK